MDRNKGEQWVYCHTDRHRGGCDIQLDFKVKWMETKAGGKKREIRKYLSGYSGHLVTVWIWLIAKIGTSGQLTGAPKGLSLQDRRG